MRRTALVLVLSLMLAGTLAVPAGSGELPDNTWVKVGEKEAGCRIGAAVVWLEKEKKFLVLGGIRNDKWTRGEKIPFPHEIMTFDPDARKWEEVLPEGGIEGYRGDRKKMFMDNGKGGLRLPKHARISSRFTYDPEGRHLFIYGASSKEFRIGCYSVEERDWKMLSTARPPARSNGVWPGEYGHITTFMEGTSPVFDPVNGELLFIGGRTGNDPEGFVGHWAFSLKENKWRQITVEDGLLDPLREKVTTAIRPARDAVAAARNIYYAAMEPEKEAVAAKGKPVGLLENALKRIAGSAEAMKSAKAYGWKVEAVKRASARLEAARGGLTEAKEGFAEGKLSAELIKKVFDAAWALDEAVDCLRVLPGARESAGVGYDPVNKSVLVFGGDHGDYLLNDTWIYDCEKKSWRQVFPKEAPKARRASGMVLWLPGQKKLALAGGSTYLPRFIYFRRISRALGDVWTFDVKANRWQLVNAGAGKGPRPTLTCALAAGDGDVLLGLSSKGRWRGVTASYWLLRIAAVEGAEASQAGVPAGTRTYFSVVREYNPCWYDAAQRGDRKKVEEWLGQLPANTWTRVPEAPRPAPQRDWGTCVFDPYRDQFYHWTGGHMADPADQVSTYHPAISRWSIPYISSYVGKGISFNGRPDCMNHTYINYTLDITSKKLVCTNFGGTCVYDPERREFEPRIAHPFLQHPYFTKTVGTSKGVVCWTRGYFGVLDLEEREWVKLPVKGKLPPIVHGDENAICYDSKRNVLWMYSARNYNKPSGRAWRYDVESGVVGEIEAKNRETIGKRFRLRESVYVPEVDKVVHNGFLGQRQVAWDPEKLSWVLLETKFDGKHAKELKKHLGGVSIGLMHDPKRKMLWAMSGGRRMFCMKLDVKSLKVIDEPREPASKK